MRQKTNAITVKDDLINTPAIAGKRAGKGARRITGTAPLSEIPVCCDDPAAIGTMLAENAHQTDGAWRARLDQSVDQLLLRADDNGLWHNQTPQDSLKTTLTVVHGLIAYLPNMPATRGYYVKQVLARTFITLHVLDAQW